MNAKLMINKGIHLKGIEFFRFVDQNGLAFIAVRGGEGEGYVNRKGEDMWFSRFHDNEFEQYIPTGFGLLRHTRTQPGRGVFLNYLLQKTQSS
jgi:hypothetical protein